jgi:3-oxoacyl-[acyl-carrier-protein] synthase II
MVLEQDIVITGIGIVSPIGIGKEDFWASLVEGRSGVRRLETYDDPDLPTPFGGNITDFDPKRYVRPRKSLKVMSRDIQLGFAAADLACIESGMHEKRVDPERLGIVFGSDLIPGELSELIEAFRGCLVDGEFDFSRWGHEAMEDMYPLWMLKYLPNMPACHIGIAQDARGPNNSLTLGDVSSLSAIAEATRVILRGQADVMIAGGTGSRVHPSVMVSSEGTGAGEWANVFGMSRRSDDPASASRPFDANRDGMVNGEGAGAFILETRQHAEQRGAKIVGRILGFANAFEPHARGEFPTGTAIKHTINSVLKKTGFTPEQIGHVNANGLGTIHGDRIEAQAIRDTLGEIPVTAPKSYFGNLRAGAGAVEMAASLLSFEKGLVPPTLNYETPDPRCPINVVRDGPLENTKPTAMVLNHAYFGQAAALLLAAPF